MPRNIRHRGNIIPFQKGFLIKIVLAAVLLSVIFLAVRYNQLWLPTFNDFLTPSWQKTQQSPSYSIPPTKTVTLTPTATVEPTPTQTPTSTMTPTSQPTAIPTITIEPPTLALDTPIGKSNQFLLHRAAPGESPGQYATKYNTTVEAIWAVNYGMYPVLYENRVIVIPLDLEDATGLPAFEPYEIKDAGLTPDSLAEMLTVAADELRFYNGIPADYTFSPGEWVLVPREPNQP